MLVSWSQRKHLNLRLTPNPNASQWNIGVVGTQRKIFALAMYISCFLCRFHLLLVANANTVFSGIWASVISQFCITLCILGSGRLGFLGFFSLQALGRIY